jgi:uncharacterized membrane protein YtjA (UPF0391 family)
VELCQPGGVDGANQKGVSMLRWAIICLVISILAGGVGLTGLSGFAKRLSMIFFALFFLGFLIFLGFAYLVVGAVSHSELLPAMVALST